MLITNKKVRIHWQTVLKHKQLTKAEWQPMGAIGHKTSYVDHDTGQALDNGSPRMAPSSSPRLLQTMRSHGGGHESYAAVMHFL